MSLSEDLFSTWRPVCCGKCTESRRSLPPKTYALQRRHRGGTPISRFGPCRCIAKDGRRHGKISPGAELRLDVPDLLICSGNCVSASDEAARQVRPLEQLAHRVARPC